MTKVHKTLDARGLSYPMPILKSRKAIKELDINQVLEILTSDPVVRLIYQPGLVLLAKNLYHLKNLVQRIFDF